MTCIVLHMQELVYAFQLQKKNNLVSIEMVFNFPVDRWVIITLKVACCIVLQGARVAFHAAEVVNYYDKNFSQIQLSVRMSEFMYAMECIFTPPSHLR